MWNVLFQLLALALRFPIVVVGLTLKCFMTLVCIAVAIRRLLTATLLYVVGTIITADTTLRDCRDLVRGTMEMVSEDFATYPRWITFLFSGGETPW